jgi:hypothetical protein
VGLLRCQDAQIGLDFTPKPATRPLGRSDYEERRAARIERQKARAERLQRVAESRHARAREIGSHIPFGQPILIGHHSEKRHRAAIRKIDANMRASIEAAKGAEVAERRARSAERNTSISSDDPEAVRRLKEKLAELEHTQERMVAGNKALRAGKSDAEIARVTGLSVERAAKLHEKDFAGRVGFPDFALKNNNAEIRRVKARIAELQTQASTPVRATEHIGNVEIREQDKRVQMIFPGKPADHVRAELKGAGFRWSPTSGAWYHARRIASTL